MATFSRLGSYWTGNCTRATFKLIVVQARAVVGSASVITFPNAKRAMLLIRLAISIFALTLLGLAFSLNAAQSQQNDRALAPAVLTLR